jgi:transposase
VKAYVKRGKTDAADAEAIAEAVTRPTMRFVAVKSKAQQAALMLHKTRDLMVRQRTMLINAVRGRLGEYGIIAAKGAAGVRVILKSIYLQQEELPSCRARQCMVWRGSLKRSSGRSSA